MKSTINLFDLYCLAVIAVVEIVGRLPSPRGRRLCLDGLALIAYALSRRKRQAIEENLTVAFSANIDSARKRQLTIACFRGFWEEMVDWVPSAAAKSPTDLARIDGIEHLKDAVAKGKGVILLESNGFGRRVLARRTLYASGYPVIQMHGATHLGVLLTEPSTGSWFRTRILRPFFERRERPFVDDILIIPLVSSMTASRVYVNRLRDNGILCVAGDGLIARKRHELDFLGGKTPFAPGMIKLAWTSGAALLPMFCVPSESDGAVLEIGPPIVFQCSGSRNEVVEHALRQYARALESRIRRHPEGFRNWHLIGAAAGRQRETTERRK